MCMVTKVKPQAPGAVAAPAAEAGLNVLGIGGSGASSRMRKGVGRNALRIAPSAGGGSSSPTA